MAGVVNDHTLRGDRRGFIANHGYMTHIRPAAFAPLPGCRVPRKFKVSSMHSGSDFTEHNRTYPRETCRSRPLTGPSTCLLCASGHLFQGQLTGNDIPWS